MSGDKHFVSRQTAYFDIYRWRITLKGWSKMHETSDSDNNIATNENVATETAAIRQIKITMTLCKIIWDEWNWTAKAWKKLLM